MNGTQIVSEELSEVNIMICGHNVCCLGQIQRICYFNTFEASCPQNNAIIMQSALYGRMDPTVCYEDGQNQDYSHCTTDVLHLTDSICSGKRQCRISIPHESFEAVMRCATKGYFEASYECLHGRCLFFSQIPWNRFAYITLKST